MANGLTDPKTIEVANQVAPEPAPAVVAQPVRRRQLHSPSTPAEPTKAEDLAALYVLPDDTLEDPKTPAGAATTTVDTATTDAVPKHSAFLTEMALDLGIPQEEIDAAETPHLESLVRHLRRVQKSQPTAAAQPVQEPPPLPRAEEEPLDFGILADPERFDKDIFGELKRIVEPLHKANQELRQKLARIEQGEEGRQAQTIAEKIDQSFASLGQSFEGIVGKGGIEQVRSNPTIMARRTAILGYAQQLAGKDATEQQIFANISKAAQEMFGVAAVPSKPAAKPLLSQEDLEAGALGRPTARRGVPPGKNGTREAAVAAVKERMAEWGGEDDDDIP